MPQHASDRFIVVTGGDEAYAPFVADLAASLGRCRPHFAFAVGLLDYGLTPETRARLATQFDAVVKPDWPYRPHAQFDKQIQARAFATRPFLPDYFPGYESYAWIDADSFVQNIRALALLREASRRNLAGVVPTIDRSYRHRSDTAQWVEDRFKMAFGAEIAARMSKTRYIASGVVAGGAASLLWKVWQTRFQAALDRWDGPRLCDQAVLNHVIQLENIPHHRLPSTCNWISHLAPPLIDIGRGALVEPSYPFDPIWIVANSFNDKASPRTLSRIDGGTVTCPLTFEGVRQAILAERAKNTQ